MGTGLCNTGLLIGGGVMSYVASVAEVFDCREGMGRIAVRLAVQDLGQTTFFVISHAEESLTGLTLIEGSTESCAVVDVLSGSLSARAGGGQEVGRVALIALVCVYFIEHAICDFSVGSAEVSTQPELGLALGTGGEVAISEAVVDDGRGHVLTLSGVGVEQIVAETDLASSGKSGGRVEFDRQTAWSHLHAARGCGLSILSREGDVVHDEGDVV